MSDFETHPVGTAERIKALETKLAIAIEAFRFIGEIPNSEAAQGLMKVISRDAVKRMREIGACPNCGGQETSTHDRACAECGSEK